MHEGLFSQLPVYSGNALMGLADLQSRFPIALRTRDELDLGGTQRRSRIPSTLQVSHVLIIT